MYRKNDTEWAHASSQAFKQNRISDLPTVLSLQHDSYIPSRMIPSITLLQVIWSPEEISVVALLKQNLTRGT